MISRTTLAALLVLHGLAAVAPGRAAAAPAERAPDDGQRRWALHVDNDLFAFADEDRDYTAGIAFSLSDDDARNHPLFLGAPLAWLDEKTRFDRLARGGKVEGYALEAGLLLFTPQDLAATEPIRDDRPYASLAYVSTSRLTHQPDQHVAHQSSLTLGVLGVPFAETLHRAVHDALGSQEPEGYAYQVSAGGEPTFRYTIGRKKLLASGSYDERPYTLQYGVGASIGYVTEATAELGFRWGSTRWPWWSSLPTSSEYAGHPPIGARTPPADSKIEVLFDAGIKARARLYNSFLQGQFRDSEVEFGSHDLNRFLVEAWIGVTTVFNDDLSVSYTVRHQTAELATGRGARGFTWASIGVAQQF